MSQTPKTRLGKLLIEAMAKHLPPSASTLRLLDVNGEAGDLLAESRSDLEVLPVPGQADQWKEQQVASASADAIVAYEYHLNEKFLTAALDALRPGGRLIVVNSKGEVSETVGEKLQDAGYTRILVETAVECPLPTGVLMRGEKPHTTADTLSRIQQVAQQDANRIDLETYKGRYVHLLVIQSPNKPVWKLQEGEQVEWRAAAVQQGERFALLAFSSLPKAVGFMQPAVLQGKIKDINKVGKFSKETASRWTFPVLLNPDLESLEAADVIFVPVDPATAEASDE